MARLVSVVIPNWNGAVHLTHCLDAVAQQTVTDMEVIVVDNGSTDNSLSLLSNYPSVRVIALPRNLGYAGGCNAGLQAATGDVLALLNNDTEVMPTWLSELLVALERHPDAGMATPKVLLWHDHTRIHTAGDYVRTNGIPDSRGVWEEDKGQFDHEEYVFGAAGVAPAYRRSMLDDIGLLDAHFHSYCEDVDLSWRAQLAGYRCIYAPCSLLYHRVSATGGGPVSSYYVARNTIWLVAKNLPAGLWRRYREQIIHAQLQRFRDAIHAWRGAAARATVRGQLAGLTGISGPLRRRRAIQRRRRVDDAYIDSMLTRV